MVVDILMAFVIALMIRMFSITSKYLKYIVVSTACITLMSIYFTNGCVIEFVGEMDLSIWIAFVILFDVFLDLLEDGIGYILSKNK